MNQNRIDELAREALAILEPSAAVCAVTDNGDGSITLHLAGGAALIWPLRAPTRENTLPVEPAAVVPNAKTTGPTGKRRKTA